MRKRITIRVTEDSHGTSLPRLRDFGEDLFRLFRSGEHVVIDLDEVDRATDEISVVVIHNRQFRRMRALIETEMQSSFPDGIASISIEDAG